MHVKIIVHDAEEGGYWGEVPALPGCASQGETIDELLANLHEAIGGWLEADVEAVPPGAERNASSNSLCEAFVRSAVGADTGKARLEAAPDQRQSPHLWKVGERARLSVPCHGATPLKRGLQDHLLKAAGLTADAS